MGNPHLSFFFIDPVNNNSCSTKNNKRKIPRDFLKEGFDDSTKKKRNTQFIFIIRYF